MFVNLLVENMSEQLREAFRKEIKTGIVVTGSSNGAFMAFIRDKLNLELSLAPTGIKHLARQAKNYDLSIFFEQNGHGTLAANSEFGTKLANLTSSAATSTKDIQILDFLGKFMSSFNVHIGDSLVNLIAQHICLHYLEKDMFAILSSYEEFPFVNLKTPVKDKNIYKPNQDESRLFEPAEVQEKIDSLLKEGERCFCRASGTEDVVRIYVESPQPERPREVAEQLKEFIKNY